MEQLDIQKIIGQEGTAGMSGGCVVPMEFKLTFRILENEVLVEVKDKWFSSEEGKFEGTHKISFERYLEFVNDMEQHLSAPPVQPIFASSEVGAGCTLPTPTGVLEGGGHECVEGPPPGAIISCIERFAENVFSRTIKKPNPVQYPAQPDSYSDGNNPHWSLQILKRFWAIIIPISILGLAFWWQSQMGESSIGEPCISSGQCSTSLCNMTDTDGFWIFDIEGHCTKPCTTGYNSGCPSGTHCRQTTFTQSRGTGLVHHWVHSNGPYCVPSD